MSKEEKEKSHQEENSTPITPKEEVKEEQTETIVADKIVVDKQSDLEIQLKELNDKFVRLFAEYDNFRRRTQKEKADLIKYGGEEIILSILPVLDDLERASVHHKEEETLKSLQEGLDLICQKTKNILSSKGVKPMEPKGEVFDPELHDAITNIPAEKEEMKGKVAEVVEKGYELNGKVIRHAKVVVAS